MLSDNRHTTAAATTPSTANKTKSLRVSTRARRRLRVCDGTRWVRCTMCGSPSELGFLVRAVSTGATSSTSVMSCSMIESSSAPAVSFPVAYRWSGLRASSVWITFTNCGASDGRSLPRSVGSRCSRARAVSASDSPTNGTRPARHSYNTNPSPYRSARPSNGFPRTCSGDKYFAVPIMMLSLVRSASVESNALAIPKSANNTFPSGVIKMLPGLTSR